jgi:hypothetical protein
MRSRLILLFVMFAGLALAVPENRVVLELEPTPANPRNSEGSFVTLKSGRILYVYTQFYGGAHDESAARLVGITSDDGGRTWSPAPRVLVENTGTNVMSVSLLRLQDGRIALFYIKKESRIDGHPHVRFSADEGASWSAAQRVVKAPGYYELNNDRAIQLKSGRIIVPVGAYRQRDTDVHTYASLDFRAITMWYFSDDAGVTWQESPQWLASPVPSTTEGLQESGVVELADGSLLGWFRTDLGSQLMARSTDAGATWTPAAPSEMKSPTSSAGIKRLPGSDRLLGIWNDHSDRWSIPPLADAPRNVRRRTPLTSGISADGGRTWEHRKLLESDPDGWYCYTAIHFTGDAVLLAYCAGDSKIGGLNRLRLRRVDLAWFTAP